MGVQEGRILGMDIKGVELGLWGWVLGVCVCVCGFMCGVCGRKEL